MWAKARQHQRQAGLGWGGEERGEREAATKVWGEEEEKEERKRGHSFSLTWILNS